MTSYGAHRPAAMRLECGAARRHVDNSYHRPVYYSRQQRTFRGRVARGSVFLRKMVCRAVAEFDIQWRSKAINSRQRGSLRVAPLLMRTYRGRSSAKLLGYRILRSVRGTSWRKKTPEIRWGATQLYSLTIAIAQSPANQPAQRFGCRLAGGTVVYAESRFARARDRSGLSALAYNLA